MIRNYSDHAANERTFLAWLRTGLAIAAFGLVIERLNFFLALVTHSSAGEAVSGARRLLVPFGRYDGLVLTAIGVAMMVMAAVRFVRTAHEIDRPEPHSAGGLHAGVLLSSVLAVLAAGFCIYLAMQ